MSEPMEIHELYRQVGDFLRARGAERVILRSSRICPADGIRELELAVDRSCGETMEEELGQKWPGCRFRVLCMDSGDWTAEDTAETEEDGIRL